MTAFNKTPEEWKAEGDRLCRARDFYQAIVSYDQALIGTTKESDGLTLLLNRCHARVSSQHFDSALEDAKAVLRLSASNEKALFRAAKALYGLRRYKESANRLATLVKIYPKNQIAFRDLQRCFVRLREEGGHFDFAAMLDEAISKSPKPDMDRADYIGNIEVRHCAVRSHGRGVFSTKSLKAGELILVEKAFCSVFPNECDSQGKYDETTGMWGNRSVRKLRAEIATSTFIKLHRNPSLVPAFADLFPGPEAVEENDTNGNAVVDDAFIQHRIVYNAFAFSILAKDWHWRNPLDSSAIKNGKVDGSSSIGMWLKASYINHSCYPTVRRSFIGDMMIWRAQIDVAPNVELKFAYLSDTQDYATRQESVAKYGFACECQICLAEKATPPATIKDRDMIMLEIVKCFEASTPMDLEVYFTLLDKIQSTYLFPLSQEPRRSLILPIMNLMEACKKSGNMLASLIKLGITLLQGLGFELDVTLSSWKIKTWGYMCDDVVSALADLWQACGTMQPRLCEGLERDVKTAFTIMAGEGESFEGMYGSARPVKLEESLRDMAGMNMPGIMTLDGTETIGTTVGKMSQDKQEGGFAA